MISTFACPHCGVTCPVRPVLVGRALRCTACKKALLLRADGVAEKIDEAPPSESGAAATDAGKVRYATLASAAEAVLVTESNHDRSPEAKKAAAKDATIPIGPAVLSDSGTREHRFRLMALFGVIGAFVVFFLALYVVRRFDLW